MNLNRIALITGLTISSITVSSHFSSASAAKLIITPQANYTATTPACLDFDGKLSVNCTSKATINPSILVGPNAQFNTSFYTWNRTLPVADQWTLKYGGDLPITFNVSIFDALVFSKNGGVDIRIRITDVPSPIDISSFQWSQGINANYSLSEIVPPFNTMDNSGSLTSPLYPIEIANGGNFQDSPKGSWPNAFLKAETFLSKADFTTRTLTVFNGVSWGFNLSEKFCFSCTRVPEPSFISGIFALGTLGAASTLKRKLKSSKSSEKETTKVS